MIYSTYRYPYYSNSWIEIVYRDIIIHPIGCVNIVHDKCCIDYIL